MASPLVTVVIPTIKPRKGFLRRAVNSIMAQTYDGIVPIEIALDRDHDGAAATRNRALMKVRTPWVAFLDDDDYFLPNHLEVLLNYASDDYDVYYTGCEVISPDFEVIPHQEEWGRFGKDFDPELLKQKSYIPVTSLVRTSLAQDALFGPPPHDKSCPYDDWGFYLRVLQNGGKFLHIPQVTWIWHHHGRNTGGQGDRW